MHIIPILATIVGCTTAAAIVYEYPTVYEHPRLERRATVSRTATFDQNNINLNNYAGAKFTNYTISSEQYDGITANSGSSFIQSSSGEFGPDPAYGTLLLNSLSTYGHLNSFYYACFTPEAFTPQSFACNFTMTASCLDNKSGKKNTFTLTDTYTRSDNMMKSINLAGFYSFYASSGYFTGNGSAAQCYSYYFTTISQDPSKNGFPSAYYLDTMLYTTTT